ncbi:NADP-dependent oxidoreductase [Paraoerskovia sediminicola]|uniref:NADP-dependent oxidoreductase n=1 Tax=Paraoerskovia sediminicola TaxID=1138587 RepID=A0ABN6XDQ5_9CELL|nr:NADP-dependent oxidoreductase [Paraoerskovia sediminicola]BDZ41701.1 NADP-dependent oxidoreductase [Paraoerskovia sediminicola]
MTTNSTSTRVLLAARPHGWPTDENFRVETVDLPALADGEVRVVNEFCSVDPYMRGRMNDVKSYVAPFALDEPLTGGAVGHVVESRSDALAVGDAVTHQLGWRDVAQAGADQFRKVDEIPGVPLSAYLGILGLTGLTAWVGLQEIAALKEGDAVFVSGAAGAVGSAAGQIARLLGASRVVGSAGSSEKVERLTSRFGFDAAFDYKAAPVREQLPQAAPDGIDLYFDNVGGDHLEAALDVLNPDGRVALCGAISGYNETEPQRGPDNMVNIVKNSLRLRGFTLGAYMHHAPAFYAAMGPWLASGEVVHDETVVDARGDVGATVGAFLGLLRGENTGKMVVRTA